MKETLLAQAQTISDRLRDSTSSFWFHYKAVKVLGFQRCNELCSQALMLDREGKIYKSAASYYNGSVMKEVKDRNLVWRYRKRD